MKLELQNLGKSYDRGKTYALSGFSEEFVPGVYGLLGPNGAGKSTLMNLMTLNLAPSEGCLVWEGENVLSLGATYRDVLGYMPQQQNLYEDFTGEEFLWYMAALKGLSKEETRQKVEELFSIVNLNQARFEKIRGYSGGMKQRLLIAQALLNDPKILIMDEPTAGLDPEERIRIRNFISEIATGKIVLLATHVISDIEFIADHIIVIKKGQKVAEGTPSELLQGVKGKVFDGKLSNEELAKLKEQKEFLVSNVRFSGKGKNHVRIIVQGEPEEFPGLSASEPELEDVYLYLEHF
ncbi:ATP-binding cassette domain-containing protein [Lachnospiraceae bacterium YH-ros2228]